MKKFHVFIATLGLAIVLFATSFTAPDVGTDDGTKATIEQTVLGQAQPVFFVPLVGSIEFAFIGTTSKTFSPDIGDVGVGLNAVYRYSDLRWREPTDNLCGSNSNYSNRTKPFDKRPLKPDKIVLRC